MIKRPFSMKLISVVVGSATTLTMLLLLTWSLENASSKTLTNQIGRAMAVLADQVQDKIDRVLTDRVRDVTNIAKSSSGALEKDLTTTQALLDHAQNSGVGFEWLGLINLDTQLVAMSGDAKFSDQAIHSPWVAMLQSHNGNEMPLFRLIPPGQQGGHAASGQPWHLELAAPVYSATGKLEAVAVGIANWDWAQSTVHSSKQSPQTYNDVELVIFANDGDVILAPPGHPARISQTKAFRQSQQEAIGWLVEADPSGTDYIAGFSRAMNQQFFDSLGLTVLVRQSAGIALAPLVDLKRRIFWYTLLFAAHAMALQYILSHNLSAPLLRIARAANDLRQTGRVNIPHVTEFAETKILSESLISLVDELSRREASLTTLSATLEAQVQDRTQALEQRNVQLAHATREVEKAIVTKSRFLAAASHDLRQPLQALNLFCAALKRRVSEVEAAAVVKHLEESLTLLGAMLDKLLHIARLDAGLVAPALEPVRLRQLIERIGAEFSVEADNRGLRFNFTSTDCHIMTDPALFETIVRNLVSNAFKFTQSGGVHLAARSRSKSVILEIYDTGPGIEQKRLESIFLEFERGREQSDGPNEGLGLGLAIVERYASLINSKVTVRSVVGRGCRFSFEVPKADAGLITAEKPNRAVPIRSIANVNVMLVDDNIHTLNALRLDLADRGAIVTGFSLAQEALDAIYDGLLVDVAIVDYDLGDETKGVDLVGRWLREGRHFGSIILTGRTDAVTLTELAGSTVPWMTKPASPDSIAMAIERLSITQQKASRPAKAV
jgi:signal transduction histidine kinase